MILIIQILANALLITLILVMAIINNKLTKLELTQSFEITRIKKAIKTLNSKLNEIKAFSTPTEHSQDHSPEDTNFTKGIASILNYSTTIPNSKNSTEGAEI